MNLVLLDDDKEARFINTDNITIIYYNKNVKSLQIYFNGEENVRYEDNDAEKIYNHLKGLATVL